MQIIGVDSTNLFVGTEANPRQVVRIRVRGEAGDQAAARVRVSGERVRTEADVSVGPLGAGDEVRLELGVAVDGRPPRGELLPAEIVVESAAASSRLPFELVVAEPGWRMFMVSHFHYDPVWWNTQAAYTEAWGAAIQYRQPFQEPGLALVKAHLEMARREPDYKFVLAELDYLKPYWDVYPEDRAYIRQLLADGRLELMGGTYNEPNTNLTSAESTIRNAIYGIGYQRHVLGGAPQTAWQLDAFGHDPQFPGIMADAGVTSSSWARGPFHEWGPHWVRGPARMPIGDLASGAPPRMQFTTEFDWVAPSGRALLTSLMANHYSAGWWMDSAATLEQAEAEVHLLFTELSELAATRNVLLPVGTDYTPPNRWLTAIQHDWNARYVWPKFIAAIPREFFDAVREERRRMGRGFSPQTRDMNPIYTGKDVSFIDTKQAQRLAENTLLGAEKFATVASLLGARYPSEAIDKAWRQLLFGAHHDGITGSESDQVYLDLLGGWREALELGKSVLEASLDVIGGQIDTTGEGLPITVFNPLSWPRTDVARVRIDPPEGGAGIEIRDDAGMPVPFALEAAERGPDGRISRATVAFLARDVPAIGYSTFRAVATDTPLEDAAWRPVDGASIQNERYAVAVDPSRGGAIVSLVDRQTGKELIRPGEVGNELRAYREYPNHPLFGEGPWHLTPDGRYTSSAEAPARVTVEESPIGRRLVVEAPFDECRRRQEVIVWDGIDRVELRAKIDDYTGADRLFRVRFPASVRGGRPVYEVGNAVVGRPFGTPNIDVAKTPFTLDNPAYNWFAVGSTARIELIHAGGDGRTPTGTARASAALGVAEIVAPDQAALDDVVRRLVVALVRQGVTSTVSSASGGRYGILHIDSNLPDFRIAIGGPADNRFVADVLAEAGDEYRRELDRQLEAGGTARLWIPARHGRPGTVEALPDLRGPRDLPVLVVAATDSDGIVGAVGSLADDLGDGVATVEQPANLTGRETVEDYTIGLLNRGMPGSSVEATGDLYLSLMRSCSGWPSGVWIDPPRRSTPDGANFQFQHWTHTFEYALVGAVGDWRAGALVRAGHEFNNPLLARAFEAGAGSLPGRASFIRVEPETAVVTAVTPAGNPIARMAGTTMDPAEGVVVRVYESSGRPTRASLSSAWPVQSAEATNATEETAREIGLARDRVELDLGAFEIGTLRFRPEAPERTANGTELGTRAEVAQPVFAQYWMHNKGAAPLGYQPVTVTARRGFLAGRGPFRVEVVVASERTDGASAGELELIVPPGWEPSPPGRIFNLAPGAHLAVESSVAPASHAPAGRYFLAARITDEAGQVHEDVVTVDYDPTATAPGSDERTATVPETAELAAAIARAMRTAGLDTETGIATAAVEERGGELEVTMLTERIELSGGETAAIEVRLRNLARSEVRGEAQLLSPHETWPSITPWTQGFAVGPDGEANVTFLVQPSYDAAPGAYWALVKVMYFGRLYYTESIEVRIREPVPTEPARLAESVATAPVGARQNS